MYLCCTQMTNVECHKNCIMKKYLVLALAVIVTLGTSASKVETCSIKSKLLNAKVQYNVYLPDGYDRSQYRYECSASDTDRSRPWQVSAFRTGISHTRTSGSIQTVISQISSRAYDIKPCAQRCTKSHKEVKKLFFSKIRLRFLAQNRDFFVLTDYILCKSDILCRSCANLCRRCANGLFLCRSENPLFTGISEVLCSVVQCCASFFSRTRTKEANNRQKKEPQTLHSGWDPAENRCYD